MLSAGAVISEFMAINHSTLMDIDGDYSDWIEIHNPTATPIDLSGWSLTDDSTKLAKWHFPTVTLGAGGYLTVFASGKDRANPAGELHTNFQLNASGEYLALVESDGMTIASAYSPEFPKQKEDFSYGASQVITPLVSAGATAAKLVPLNGNVAASWMTPSFVDFFWTKGPTGIGYETGIGQNTAIAYGNNAGNLGTQDYGGSLGLDFYVRAPIYVTQLGVFDSGSDGLALTLTSQLWQRTGDSGTLLTQLSFTPASPGTLVGGDRFKPLATPLLLQPGDYTIVAYGYGVGELNGNEGTGGPENSLKTMNDGSGAIEFVGSGRYGVAGSFPSSPDGGPVNRYSAGTFEFQAPAYSTLIKTDVKSAMSGINASVYSRISFNCGVDPATFDSLSLQMKYDDGFVAYLNGTKIASRNAPSTLQWNSTATAIRPTEQAKVFENINVTAYKGLLHTGTNVLAIQGLNASASDTDFLLLPQLIAAGMPDTQSRYFDTPTPGSPNNSTSSFAGFVDDVKFSVQHGFFQSPFDVTVTTATAGAAIYYTLDGTVPSPTHGSLYQGPIHVSTTTTLRAGAFKTDLQSAPINTETYLFLDAVLDQTNTPAGYPTVWNGGYTADYGMSQNTADLPLIAGNASYTEAQYNQAIKDSLLSLPTISIVLPADDMFDPATGIYVNPFGRNSDVWEKAASVEYLLPDGSPGFQINGGLQIMGFTSRDLRTSPQLSMRLLFKKEYGAASLDYPFFPDSGRHKLTLYPRMFTQVRQEQGSFIIDHPTCKRPFEWDTYSVKKLSIVV
jgi:hypothetical protein